MTAQPRAYVLEFGELAKSAEPLAYIDDEHYTAIDSVAGTREGLDDRRAP